MTSFRLLKAFLLIGLGSICVAAAGSLRAASSEPSLATTRQPPRSGILDEDSDPGDFPNLESRTLNWRNARGEIEFGALVGPYSNSDASPVERLVALARRTVDIEIYEMDDPGFRRSLRDALKRNVVVRVIKEPHPIGERCDFWKRGAPTTMRDEARAACLDGQALAREIVASGGRFEKFDKNLCGQRPLGAANGQRARERQPRRRRCFQHGKAIVIDGRVALISTGNFNATSLCNREVRPRECNRDYTYVTRDAAAVASLARIFELDLQKAWHDPRSVLRAFGAESKLTVSPWSLAPLKGFLKRARASIQIQNQYLYPDSGLVEVLLDKARAGVRVEIHLADVCYYGRPKDNARTVRLRLMFQELETAGAKIRMFPKAQKVAGLPGKLHAKAIVIDGERAWIGSVNGSSTAMSMNREFGIFFNHARRAPALARFMAADFSNPESQTWQESFDCRRSGEPAGDAGTLDEDENGEA